MTDSECGALSVCLGNVCRPQPSVDAGQSDGATSDSVGADAGSTVVDSNQAGVDIDASAPVAPEDMVAIPAGTFVMGDTVFTDKAGKVAVPALWIDRTEVTAEAYAKCVTDTLCTAPSSKDAACNYGVAGREKHPINCVDWAQAQAYCAYVGRRLPTEEEWEYVARGTDGRIYTWGSDLPKDQPCWSGGSVKRTTTCVVGTNVSADSPFKVSDMAGNVWEWMASAYQDPDPQPPTERVHRGGSFGTVAEVSIRAAHRHGQIPNYQSPDVGFRCAQTPPSP